MVGSFYLEFQSDIIYPTRGFSPETKISKTLSIFTCIWATDEIFHKIHLEAYWIQKNGLDVKLITDVIKSDQSKAEIFQLEAC